LDKESSRKAFFSFLSAIFFAIYSFTALITSFLAYAKVQQAKFIFRVQLQLTPQLKILTLLNE